MNALRTVLLLLVALLAGPARAADGGCTAPPELVVATAPLPATAAALKAGRLRVLVGGSASVLGPGTSGTGAPWPQRLEALLRARYPQVRVEFVVKGGRGLTAGEIGAFLAAESAKEPAALVLWQTGTVEAARGLDVDHLVETLLNGLNALDAAGSDAVLIDLQFSRFLRANAQVDAYLDALRVVAAAHDISLFRRYELMQGWAENDVVDLERALPAQRVAATDKLNDCVARALEQLLQDGIAAAKRR